MASRKSKGKNKSRRRRRRPPESRNIQAGGLRADSSKDTHKLAPRVAAGEPLEDSAVFLDASREKLSAELQLEARAVAESLDKAHQGDFDGALECVSGIARSSPFSQWRLLVRGLVAFYGRDLDAARQNWARLDPARRPARIASTLLRAETDAPLAGELSPPPKSLVASAQRLRLRPEVINAARRIAAERHRDPEITFSLSQVSQLKQFRAAFARTDSRFVERFSQACVRLACFQPFTNVLEKLKREVPGPPYDPRWNLQTCVYWCHFDDAVPNLQKATNAFIHDDLPTLAHIPQDVRKALASAVWMLNAHNSFDGRRIGFLTRFGATSDLWRAERSLQNAIKWLPANRKAHQELIQVLEIRLDEWDIAKDQAAKLNDRLVAAKTAFVKEFPSEVDTTLWLIHHHLKQDELEEADGFVQQLSSQRVASPLIRILPWTLKIREATRLSRRKSGLAAVPEALDAAESIWPDWFSRDWLLFLRAAFELRRKDRGKFETLDAAARAACGAPQWVGDIISFAALRQMSLPSAELKPFREAVDRHIRNAARAPLEELFVLGAFFWDLTRLDLQYTGFAMQSSKIAKALLARLNAAQKFEATPAFADTCSWLARKRFGLTRYSDDLPVWVASAARNDPKAAAAALDWRLAQGSFGINVRRCERLIQLVQEASRTESNAFYRYRFEKLALDASQLLARVKQDRSQGGRFGGSSWDDDDDDDDFEYKYESDRDSYDRDSYDDDSFDDVDDPGPDDCDCSDCVARRAREKAATRKTRRTRSTPTARAKPKPKPKPEPRKPEPRKPEPPRQPSMTQRSFDFSDAEEPESASGAPAEVDAASGGEASNSEASNSEASNSEASNSEASNSEALDSEPLDHPETVAAAAEAVPQTAEERRALRKKRRMQQKSAQRRR